MITDKEKIAVYESLLHKIQLYREVTMNNDGVIRLLDSIGNWSYAHRAGNGEDTTEAVENAFVALKKAL